MWHLLSGTESHLIAVFLNLKDVCFHVSTFESKFFHSGNVSFNTHGYVHGVLLL